MKALHVIAFTLAMVGALNWGLVGIGGFVGADWNLVHIILGAWPAIEWIVYILVGLSAILLVVGHKHQCKECSASAGTAGM